MGPTINWCQTCQRWRWHGGQYDEDTAAAGASWARVMAFLPPSKAELGFCWKLWSKQRAAKGWISRSPLCRWQAEQCFVLGKLFGNSIFWLSSLVFGKDILLERRTSQSVIWRMIIAEHWVVATEYCEARNIPLTKYQTYKDTVFLLWCLIKTVYPNLTPVNK